MTAKEQLIELRRFLGSDEAYCAAIWAIRANASTPPPKAFQRGWAWKRPKVVSLAAYRVTENELAGNGRGLR